MQAAALEESSVIMRFSLCIAAYLVVTFVRSSAAARMSLRVGRHHSSVGSAVRVSDDASFASMMAHQTTHSKIRELVMLQSETRKMDSDITNVQSKLHSALVSLRQFLDSTPLPPPATNHHKNASSVNHTESGLQTEKAAVFFPAMAAVNKSLKLAKQAKASKVTKAKAVVGAKARIQQEASVLDKLFKHLKSNIVKLNSEERSGKKTSEEAIQRLQARLKKDKAALQNKGLSAFEHELLVNRTKTEEFEINYWSRDRSLGHSKFHDNLKITHGLMSRVRDILAAYKQAASKGHVDKSLMKKVEAQSEPKVFIQMREDLEASAQAYYSHVLAGMGTLSPA